MVPFLTFLIILLHILIKKLFNFSTTKTFKVLTEINVWDISHVQRYITHHATNKTNKMKVMKFLVMITNVKNISHATANLIRNIN